MKREDLKSLLSSFKEEDFFTNVDLHIHSDISDGLMAPCDIVKAAEDYKMKYISISDHNTLDAYQQDCTKNKDFIIPAAEFDCLYKGVLIHIIGYGININNEKLKSILAKSENGKKHKIYRVLHLRNTKKVIETIKEAGGVPVLAHPACYWCINLDTFIKELKALGIEGLEVFYPYKRIRGIIKFHSRKTVYKLAQKYELIKTGGSDSHGRTYHNFSLTSLSI